MSELYEEPPDENETFENLDEAFDAEDIEGGGTRHEGRRDLDLDLVVDQEELRELGAQLDDPDRIALLSGGMDDPDGAPSPAPVPHLAGEGSRTSPVEGTGGLVLPALDDPADPEFQVVPVDPEDLEQVPDDAPGPGTTA